MCTSASPCVCVVGVVCVVVRVVKVLTLTVVGALAGIGTSRCFHNQDLSVSFSDEKAENRKVGIVLFGTTGLCLMDNTAGALLLVEIIVAQALGTVCCCCF